MQARFVERSHELGIEHQLMLARFGGQRLLSRLWFTDARQPLRRRGAVPWGTSAAAAGVYLRKFIMPTKSIAVPDAVYERVQQVAAAEGTTVEQLATKAIERDLARRWLDRIGREGDQRRGDMSDAEVEAVVERAVQESRTRS